jgi:hypothetical protein
MGAELANPADDGEELVGGSIGLNDVVDAAVEQPPLGVGPVLSFEHADDETAVTPRLLDETRGQE